VAEKLGELLVRNGLISAEQLEEVLNAQVLFGGRLGTNLVESGMVGASTLAHFLARQLSLPALELTDLEKIDASVLEKVPTEVAERHLVVPLRIEKRSLFLGMADPTDMDAMDEIAFQTGLAIKPVVMPEMLLSYALERFYKVTRPSRFVRIRTRSGPQLPEPPSRTEGRGPIPLKSTLSELADATMPKGVLQAAMDFLVTRFERVAFFVAEAGVVRGWGQSGCQEEGLEVPADFFTRIRIGPDESKLLRRAAKPGPPRLVPLGPSEDQLLAMLRHSGARDMALMLPFHHQQKFVAVALAADEREAGTLAALEAYDVLAERLGLALERVRLRARIVKL
jgi:hypothetical protein